MDDINTTISQILSNPESMNQLRAVAQSLGLNPDGPPPSFGTPQGANNGQESAQNNTPSPQAAPQGGMPDLSALAGMLGALSGGANGGNTAAPSQAPPSLPIDPRTIGLLQSAFTRMNQPDKNVDLLRALKPHFASDRGARVDQAIRLLQLFSLLPVLRESGLLSGLSGLLGGTGGLGALGNLLGGGQNNNSGSGGGQP